MFSPSKHFNDLQPYERDMLRAYLVKPYLIKLATQLGLEATLIAKSNMSPDELAGELVRDIRLLQTGLAKSQRLQKQTEVRLAEISQLHFDFLKENRHEKNRSI
jgi:hypothetical protein